MLPACLPVQELWDHILGQLYGNDKALRACSLVCWSFVTPSQALIFHDIFITRFGSSPTRLADLFTASPHLIRHTRTLILGDCDIVHLAPIVGIPWSSLRRLELCGMSRAPPALDEIYTLVGLRSLQHLVFDGRRWSAGQILAIMGHCTPALERLEFRGCDPQFTLPSSSNAFQRPKIRHLGLHDSSVVGVLADPAFPVDISALTYLQCKTPAMSLALLKLIFPVQSTIKTLEFQQTRKSFPLKHAFSILTHHPVANDDPVDLALFPALFPSLQHLNLGDFWVPVSDAHMHPHIRMLVRLPAQNSIHTVSISLFLHAYATQQWGTAEALRGDLRALHAALTADNLSALRRVEVAVDAASALRTLGLGEAGWRGIVEDAMPGLRKRRVLLICAL